MNPWGTPQLNGHGPKNIQVKEWWLPDHSILVSIERSINPSTLDSSAKNGCSCMFSFYIKIPQMLSHCHDMWQLLSGSRMVQITTKQIFIFFKNINCEKQEWTHLHFQATQAVFNIKNIIVLGAYQCGANWKIMFLCELINSMFNVQL